jgi:hypothetical protein
MTFADKRPLSKIIFVWLSLDATKPRCQDADGALGLRPHVSDRARASVPPFSSQSPVGLF